MHSANVLESELREPAIEASECVTANNGEVMKQATVLIRLVRLLDSYGGAQGSYGELVGRIARKLENHLGIWDLYLRKDEEELASAGVELERALDEREVLEIRRNVGDVGDEEYGLKLAAVDWSIGDLRLRKSRLDGSVRAMCGLLGQLEQEYVDELGEFALGDFEMVRGLGLGSELTELVIRDFSRILEKLG